MIIIVFKASVNLDYFGSVKFLKTNWVKQPLPALWCYINWIIVWIKEFLGIEIKLKKWCAHHFLCRRNFLFFNINTSNNKGPRRSNFLYSCICSFQSLFHTFNIFFILASISMSLQYLIKLLNISLCYSSRKTKLPRFNNSFLLFLFIYSFLWLNWICFNGNFKIWRWATFIINWFLFLDFLSFVLKKTWFLLIKIWSFFTTAHFFILTR